MKRSFKTAVAIMAAAMLTLSGCGGNEPNTSSPAATDAPSQSTDSSRPEKPTKAKIIKSTKSGNSGTVTLEPGDTYAVISVRDFGDITVKLYPDETPYSFYNFTELAKQGVYNGRNFHRIVDNFMIQGGSANGSGSGGSCIDGGDFKGEVNTSLRHYYGALCYAASGVGDISDGFYIVNSKKTSTDVDSAYASTASMYKRQAAACEEQLANTSESDTVVYNYYNNLRSSSNVSALGAEAMADTITDAVRETYAEKGGMPSIDGVYTVFGQTVDGFDVIDKISSVERVMGNDNAVSSPVNEVIIEKIEIFTKE